MSVRRDGTCWLEQKKHSGFLLCDYCRSRTCLWNSSIIPDVAFVRKHVGYVTKIPLLQVLFQRVERIFGGDLRDRPSTDELQQLTKQRVALTHYVDWEKCI